MRRGALRGLGLTILLLSNSSHGQSPCGSGYPRCKDYQVPYQGHGPASSLPTSLCSNCSGDNRRVIVVRIDSTWGSPTTNSNVWNAVNCAIGQWNSATDQYGNHTGYYFVLDQGNVTGVSTADLTVTNSAVTGGLAETDSYNNQTSANRQNTITSTPPMAL